MNGRAALLPLVVLLTAACGQVASSPKTSPTGSASGHYQVILAESFNGGSTHLTVRDASSGKLLQRLPSGTPAPDWSRLYWISMLADSNQLNATDLGSGRLVAHTKIPSGFQLPVLGQGVSGGISPNGQWLTLYRQTRDGGAVHSNFSIGSSDLSKPFKNVQLSGDFTFDAISNDGYSLYLIHQLDDQGHYQVRLYNVAAGLLEEFPVVDKREPNEPMNGIRGDSVPAVDGSYVFTVYARADGPFIHALPLNQAFAWCVDLPGQAGANMEEQFHWSLALGRNGSTLYAVNGSTGLIAELSVAGQTSPPALLRQSHFAATNPSALSGLITDAAAKEAPIGGVALSPDGATLYAVGVTGIVAIDTATLKVRARYLQGETIPSVRLSTDGKWLYATAPGAGKIWQLDAATGAVTHELSGIDNPWALFSVRAVQ